MTNLSLAQRIKRWPSAKRKAWYDSLSDKAALDIRYDWTFWARPDQLEPEGDWLAWLLLAGRGYGKTRVGAEWVKKQAINNPGWRIALCGRTAADVRDTMIEGESGILAVSHPSNYPAYEPSKRRVTWPNGSMATAYSADEPNLLRGPQHNASWVDELAAWRYFDSWDQLQFGLRLGERPRVIVTTTPRPLRVIRELVRSETTHVTRGSTYDNKDNLAPAFMDRIISRYEGTTIGRQELMAELLDEMPGALWTRDSIDGSRVKERAVMSRIVVAIDPATTSREGSDETGIVAAGVGDDGLYYVLADGSGIMSPDGWARKAVDMFDELGADRVIAETNQGGDMVELTIRSVRPDIPYKGVHASRGKRARAEPIAALYEQGKVRHVGMFPDLEDQLVNYVPGLTSSSPDRLDALVWAITALHTRPVVMAGPDDLVRKSKWRMQ